MICQSWKVMFQAEYSSGQPLRMLVDLRASVDAALGRGSGNAEARTRKRRSASRRGCAPELAATGVHDSAARVTRERPELHRKRTRSRRPSSLWLMRTLPEFEISPRAEWNPDADSQPGQRNKNQEIKSRSRQGTREKESASGSTDCTGYLRRRGVFAEHHRTLANGAPRAHVHDAQRRSLAAFDRQFRGCHRRSAAPRIAFGGSGTAALDSAAVVLRLQRCATAQLVRERWPRTSVLRCDENWLNVLIPAAGEAVLRAARRSPRSRRRRSLRHAANARPCSAATCWRCVTA